MFEYKSGDQKVRKSVLLVGGAGYIGPAVTKNLLSAGAAVTCLDLLLYENRKAVNDFLDNSDYKFIHGDMADSDTLQLALQGITDVVILAGLVGDPITKKFPLESNLINEIGIQRCIKKLAMKNLDKVILISTCSNYGMIPNDILANEEFPLSPLSQYSRAKVSAEQFLLSEAKKADYSAVVLRFATAFGIAPRTRFDLTVNEFTRELALQRNLLVFDPDTWRPYCHIEDFGRLVSKVIFADREVVSGQIFNAGGANNIYTKRQIVESLLHELPGSTIVFQNQGPDPRNYRVDFTKVREILQFEPTHSIESGIKELLLGFEAGLFKDVDERRNFYGNYEIEYKPR